MTDDQSGAHNNELKEAKTSLKKQAINVISVGLGEHPKIEELKTMATNEENVILIPFSEQINTKQNIILKCKLYATCAMK
jgi:ABC-type uncharacterized transport system substrate-binding protein